MTGTPLVLAAAIWLNGINAALLITPVIGGCAVLSFGGLAGRLAGPGWAPAAAAVLALSLPQQYTSRGTFSEPLAQVLLFGGLCLLADSLVINRNTKTDWAGQDKVLAALAGLALGLTILVRIDGLSDILPAVPFLGVLLAARRRQAVPFGVALVIGVGYGLADGYLKSRPYLDLEAPSLRPLGYIVAAAIVATAAGLAITATPRARGTAKRLLATKTAHYLPAAAAVLTLLIFVALAVRPLVQHVAGETNPTSIAYVAELQKLAGLPVNGRRQYYEESLYWVIWYLGVPAVLLGAFGLAVLAKRCTRALLTWNDPTAAARVWALPLMMAIWTIVTVLYRPAVAPDQPWASRRLVPFVLPGLILGGVWAAAWLKEQAAELGRTRVTAVTIASCCAASMLIPTALTTLDLGFTKANGVDAHGMAFRTDRHRRAHRGQQTVPANRPGRLGGHPRPAHRRPLRPGRPRHLRHPHRDPSPSRRAQPGHPGHREGRPPSRAAGREQIGTSRLSGPQGSGQPADHAGGAQPDRAPDPDLAYPLHRLDECHGCAPTRPRGLVSSPLVSTFTPEDQHERVPHVSIVLPCFNEEEHVLLEIERICTAMDKSGLSYELLAIDDGSTDQTLARLRRAEPDFPSLTVIAFRRNGGAGTVRRIGTQQARGDIVVWTDADLTYPNERIPEFAAILDEDPTIDQVVGARTSEEGTLKVFRVPAKWFVRKLAERLTNADIPDLNSGLRAFRRSVALPYLKLLPPGFSCVTTITLAFLSNGHEVRYVPIDYAKRAGRSKFHFFSDAYRYVLQVLRMVMYFNPLKVLMPPALTLLILGVLKGIYDLVVHPLHFANDTILIFVTGMILASLALLADLIVRSRGDT